MDLSKFLRDKRLKAGLSQGAVAKKLGYSTPQFVSNWERGLSRPPIATLRKVALLYDISLDEMFEVVLQETIGHITEDLTNKFNKTGKGKS